MDTYQIEIIEPGAKKLLDDMAEMDLITVQPIEPRKRLKKLLERMRISEGNAPSLEEITAEVESVRAARYGFLSRSER